MGAVHGTRRRSFEVDSFAVVSTAVAGALELVFAGLPIWCAAEVRAACVDHEEAIGCAVNPYAVFLLELGIDAQSEFRWVADLKTRVGFKQDTMKKEPEEAEE